MTLSQILTALNGPSYGLRATDRAKLGFLEWVGSQPDTVNLTHAASDAVIRMHSYVANDPAVALFRDLMTQAARPLPHPVRRGGRRRLLH